MICDYKFTEKGLEAMYEDSLDLIWEALEDNRPKFDIDELDICVSIGDRRTKIPLHADSFEMLFECLVKIAEEE